MRKWAPIVVVSLATALSGVALSAVFDFKYLASASNDAAAALLISNGNPSQEDRQRVATEACSALKQLSADPQLDELIQQTQRGRAKAASENTLAQIYSSLGMLNRFAATEAEKLQEAGYNPTAAALILANLSTVNPGPGGALAETSTVISGLQGSVCRVSESSEISYSEIVGIGIGLGGVALIGVDVFYPPAEVFEDASTEFGWRLVRLGLKLLG